MVSRYRCRHVVSWFCTPCHFSGKGRRDFVSISHFSTMMVGSPFFVVKCVPCTPIKSPRSIHSIACVKLLSSSTSTLKAICSLPVWSWRVPNIILPISLHSTTLPAIFTVVSSFRSDASFKQCERSNDAAYGCPPLLRISCAFFSLNSSIMHVSYYRFHGITS